MSNKMSAEDKLNTLDQMVEEGKEGSSIRWLVDIVMEQQSEIKELQRKVNRIKFDALNEDW